MEKVRELTKALEKALNQQRNKFQEFLNKWTTVSQEKTSEKIMNFYHDLLHFNYDVFYAYGEKELFKWLMVQPYLIKSRI